MFEIIKFGAENFVLFKEIKIDIKKLGTNFIFINGRNLDVSGAESNMSGKSLIGDLLTDLLFDNTIRKHSQDSLVGKFKKYSSEFILLKDKLTKESYLIRKFRNHPTHKSKTFFLKKAGGKTIDLTRKTKADTYRVIWKVLGINWKTYKNSNFFGQDDRERFLDVTDAKKADIIIDIQSLQDLQNCKELSRKKRRQFSTEEVLLSTSLESAKKALIVTEESLVLLKKDIKKELLTFDEEIKDCQVKEESFSKKILEANKMIKILPNARKKISDLQIEIERIRNYFGIITKEETLFSKINEKAKGLEREIQKLVSRISEKEEEILQIENKKQKICKYCSSILDKEKSKKVCARLAEEISVINKEKKDLSIQVISFQDRATAQQEDIELMKKEYKVLNLSKFENERDLLLKEISPMEEENRSISIFEKSIKELQERIESFKKKKLDPPGKKSYIEFKKRQKREKSFLVKLIEDLEKIQEEVRKNEFSEKVFDRTIRIIFDRFLSDLNFFSAKYLDILCDDSIDILFSPKIERKSRKIVDEINVAISVNGNSSRPFRTYCGGEKSRVELSTQLGLFSSTKSSIPFLFLDEPFHGVDTEGRRRMVELLQKKADEGTIVAVISHEDIPFSYGRTLTVVREKNESRLEES